MFASADAADLLEGLSRGRHDLQGQVAPIIQALADGIGKGNEVAVEVSRHGGRELGKRAAALVTKLGMVQETFPVVLAGGLFRTHNPVLLETLQHTVQAVAPRAYLKPLPAPPVVGSVLMAMDRVGVDAAPEVRDALTQEATRRLGLPGGY